MRYGPTRLKVATVILLLMLVVLLLLFEYFVHVKIAAAFVEREKEEHRFELDSLWAISYGGGGSRPGYYNYSGSGGQRRLCWWG